LRYKDTLKQEFMLWERNQGDGKWWGIDRLSEGTLDALRPSHALERGRAQGRIRIKLIPADQGADSLAAQSGKQGG
jgi:hypothetical protein